MMLTRLALPALRRRANASRCLTRAPTTWRSASSSSCASAAPQMKSVELGEKEAAGPLALLEKSIALRQSTRALAYFNQLEQLPSALILQKLTVLLAKQPSRAHSSRAFDILLSVYKCVSLGVCIA